MNNLKLTSSLERIVRLLINRDFTQLVALDSEKQLTAEDLAEALDSDYGGVVTFPENGMLGYDFCPVDGEEYLVLDYNLLINGKASWLTLQCQFFYDESEDYYPFAVYGLHAL